VVRLVINRKTIWVYEDKAKSTRTESAACLALICFRGRIDADLRERSLGWLLEDSNNRLVIFPEGGSTTGLVGLMRFKSFAFALGKRVLPIAIVNRHRWSVNLNYVGSAWCVVVAN
jgi:hypothetical protein